MDTTKSSSRLAENYFVIVDDVERKLMINDQCKAYIQLRTTWNGIFHFHLIVLFF